MRLEDNDNIHYSPFMTTIVGGLQNSLMLDINDINVGGLQNSSIDHLFVTGRGRLVASMTRTRMRWVKESGVDLITKLQMSPLRRGFDPLRRTEVRAAG